MTDEQLSNILQGPMSWDDRDTGLETKMKLELFVFSESEEDWLWKALETAQRAWICPAQGARL